jgi:hypothetical protein
MQQHTYHDTADQRTRRPWHRRACVRRAVCLRVDYATADGRGWLGLIRNLSHQGMYIDSALRHVAHEVAPGNLLTVAFVLPSGRPCKLRAIVIHCGRRGCGVQHAIQHPAPGAVCSTGEAVAIATGRGDTETGPHAARFSVRRQCTLLCNQRIRAQQNPEDKNRECHSL